MRVLVLSLLLFTSCRGDRAPPIQAGEGLRGDARRLEVDPARVPFVADCEGFLVRTATGWSCGGEARLATASLEGELTRLKQQITDLEAARDAADLAQGTLAAQVGELDRAIDAFTEDRRTLPFRLGAVACPADEATIAAGVAKAGFGQLRMNDGKVGIAHFHCPVIALGSTWTRFSVTFRDPDGAGDRASVRARLRRIDVSNPAETIMEIDSTLLGRTGPTADAVLDHVFDFERWFYFVEIEIERTDASIDPTVFGFELGG